MLECGIYEVLSETEGPVVVGATVESSEDNSSSTAARQILWQAYLEQVNQSAKTNRGMHLTYGHILIPMMPILLQILMSHLS